MSHHVNEQFSTSKNRKRVLGYLSLAVLAGALAACGGDGGGSASDVSSPWGSIRRATGSQQASVTFTQCTYYPDSAPEEKVGDITVTANGDGSVQAAYAAPPTTVLFKIGNKGSNRTEQTSITTQGAPALNYEAGQLDSRQAIDLLIDPDKTMGSRVADLGFSSADGNGGFNCKALAASNSNPAMARTLPFDATRIKQLFLSKFTTPELDELLTNEANTFDVQRRPGFVQVRYIARINKATAQIEVARKPNEQETNPAFIAIPSSKILGISELAEFDREGDGVGLGVGIDMEGIDGQAKGVRMFVEFGASRGK